MIAHPRLFERLERTFYPSIVTVEEPVRTRDSYGDEISAWVAIGSATAIRAAIAPATLQSSEDAETRLDAFTRLATMREATLAGYYPAIGLTTRLVEHDTGRIYRIVGVEHDSQCSHTRLQLEDVTT